MSTTALQHTHTARLKEKGLRVATLRNGGIGFLISGVVLVAQWNKARKNEKNWQKFKSEWTRYLMKYPLFLATFTLLYKTLIKLGRQLSGYRGLHKRTGERLFGRKLCITIGAFLCGYTAQRVSPIFSWNWALYALLRSLLGIFRLITPADLSPNPADVYFLIHGCLPWLITYNIDTVPHSYVNFFKSCLDEKQAPYIAQYACHNHGVLPNCADTVHLFDASCLKAHIKDGLYRFRICLLFYLKFYVLTSLLGGLKFLKNLFIRKPVATLSKLLNQSVRSCLFLFLSFHFPSRIHCLWRYVLTQYHRVYKHDKYAMIACNQMWIMLVVSAIFGTLCLRFEQSSSKQSDIALFSIWRLIEQFIRKCCHLHTHDRDDTHPVLGNANLPAILFGVSIALTVYVQLTDSTQLKSLERSIISVFLA
mmetsp:Transcript_50284/g.80072  ORF Transcript_50284/g.80072 Transcript_50284/m.80072 type:complete len:421 (+) Transcript_50284:27-1289(+)